VYHPSVAIVDLGLPDGNGEDLIKDLVKDTPRPLIVLGAAGDPHSRDTAMTAGADGFLVKPITPLAAFQEAILANLLVDRHPHGPRMKLSFQTQSLTKMTRRMSRMSLRTVRTIERSIMLPSF